MFQERILPIIINDQKEAFINKNHGVPRHIDIDSLIKSERIIVITGIRRSGKSTLLRQIAEKINFYHYVNFDDERFFNFELNDFQKLMLHFSKVSEAKTIFIDEIQNVPNWERFVRRIHEENYKIFITGSNAKLLSSELSTHLTGRYKKIELYPFSFSEYLAYKKVDTNLLSTNNIAKILNALDTYLIKGGFPEYIKNNDIEYLQSTYNDIIYKDLIARFKIKNQKAFKNLSLYLFSNFTKEMSYNSLKALTGISNSNTIKDYIEYLQQAYLLFECYKFDYSLKKQNIYNKKVYIIDNGLRNSIAFKFNKEYGQLLENLIYIELKRRNKKIYFYKTKDNHEVDFIVYENPVKLIQVSYTILDKGTVNREKRSLLTTMKELNLKTSMIITYNEEFVINENDKEIKVIPVWKFLMQL